MLGFIGAGRMGGSLIRGLLASGQWGAHQVMAAEAVPARRGELEREFAVGTTGDPAELVRHSTTVVLAVKPQDADGILDVIAPVLTEEHRLISIVAGLSTDKIYARIGRDIPVVRVMPNAPALVGKGMAAVSAGRHASAEAVAEAVSIFGAVGETAVVEESLQNLVTALSGSGPAYFYLFAGALAEAGAELGMDEGEARRLIVETMAGAAEVMRVSGEDIGKLIEQVASPGGTTAAALEVLDSAGLRAICRRAVAAALKRTQELSE